MSNFTLNDSGKREQFETGSVREIWKPIPNYDGYYEASNTGLVRGLSRKIETVNGPRKIEGSLIRPFYNKFGYQLVTLYKNGSKKKFQVHRLVMITFKGIDNIRPEVNHIDGDKTNNNLNNLEWCTSQENSKHAHKTGLKKVKAGEDSPYSRLSLKQVIVIIQRIANGEKQKDLAKEYGLSPQTVNGYWKRRSFGGLENYKLPTERIKNGKRV
jgi:hypothetical protein